MPNSTAYMSQGINTWPKKPIGTIDKGMWQASGKQAGAEGKQAGVEGQQAGALGGQAGH